MLTGDFTAGPWYPDAEGFLYGTTRRSMLVHTVDTSDDPAVSVIGISQPQHHDGLIDPITHTFPPPERDHMDACYASALLESVACISIFRDAETMSCRGLIINYLNGSQRALGSCRLSMDFPESIEDLTMLWFKHFGDPRAPKVKLSQEKTVSGGWTQLVEGRRLEVWFTTELQSMALTDEDRLKPVVKT